MLLSQAIETQTNIYNDIQAQINELQEQQRQIQVYLQRLGSVESKMESAAALLEEAIAEIGEVCPEELAGYKEVITSLFAFPIARLEPGVEEEEAVQEPSPTPQPPTDDSEESEEEVITIDANQIEIQTNEESLDETDNETIEDKIVEIVKTVDKLSWRDFTSFVSSISNRSINTKGRDRDSIRREFEQALNRRQMQADLVNSKLKGFIVGKTLKSA
ncbi:hypothetical protein [Brasilonema sp. UFV-L1]|uniref:hypothetical protein n=1 Tax=Brasilonema sp. UFV-L1 TaxID=2234130 RepID=UPI00145C535D|nr:hypothetical protein [Brasilonema sp. UFV-L1]NMG10821.1 hypothetical protein [Brasilonema sp. UFV-L1]